jgi:predicted DNA-binding transcriptional regulator YafY
MRASRLLSIQMLLETRGRMSARALAGLLETSVRTLHRDVDQLAAAGVPIFAERGRAGGFRLLEGWRTTLTGLTPGEAQAVFMSGLAGPAAELGLGGAVESARLKLLSSLPSAWRDDAQRIASRFHLDPIAWYRQSDPVPHLAAVADAVWSERELVLRYESWKATAERVVSPLGLVLKAGAWYLVAAIDGEPRTYRIASIQKASVLERAARRPANFHLAAYWNDSMRRLESGLYTGRATLLATPAGLKTLRGLSRAVANAIAGAPAATRSDGRTEVTIPIESIENTVAQLLGLSPQIEVLQPLALRRALLDRIGEIGLLYGLSLAKKPARIKPAAADHSKCPSRTATRPHHRGAKR